MSDLPRHLDHRVVSAAMRHRDTGLIVACVRHGDEICRAVIEAISGSQRYVSYEQGFIDNRYRFLTRTEAWVVAEKAGQIKWRCGGDTANGGTLYSENLY